MRRLLAVVAIALAMATTVSSAVPMVARAAVGAGALTWTVDQKKNTITVSGHLQIYLGPCIQNTAQAGGAEGGPGSTGRDCTATAAQIGQAMKRDIESTWNGHFYKCYRLIVQVDVTATTSRFSVDPNRIGVRVDRSVETIRSWVEPTWGSKVDMITGDNWQSNDPADRVNVDNGTLHPTTWAYPPGAPHTYAHEFGHVLGLDDQYVEGTWGPKPGAPSDLMWSTQTSFIDQTTIDRVVERNRDRLFDTQGKALDLSDLVCEPQFRVTFSGDQAEYGASNIMDSIVNPPCSRLPITGSQDQSLRIDSTAPVDVHVVEAQSQAPLGYLLVPNFDVLTVQNGLTGGGRGGAAVGLFDMPVKVQVTRHNSQPASGDVPAVLDIPIQACPGGSPGGSGPLNDCGIRTYNAWLAMSERNGNALWPIGSSLPTILRDIGYSQVRLDKLYQSCSGPTPWPGAFVDESGGTVVAGPLPTLDQLTQVWKDWVTDGKANKIEIDGSAELKTNQPGTLANDWFKWTLTLCPLDKDGQVPPDCP